MSFLETPSPGAAVLEEGEFKVQNEPLILSYLARKYSPAASVEASVQLESLIFEASQPVCCMHCIIL